MLNPAPVINPKNNPISFPFNPVINPPRNKINNPIMSVTYDNVKEVMDVKRMINVMMALETKKNSKIVNQPYNRATILDFPIIFPSLKYIYYNACSKRVENDCISPILVISLSITSP